MQILITGGDGVLAKYVRESLVDFEILSPGKEELDITNKKDIKKFFKENKIDRVIHLAAKTNVDECEKNPKEAFLINAEGTKNVAEASKENGAFLVYVSTAAVFNGKKYIFYEDDKKNPVNIYGKSKLLGEEHINKILSDFLIIRAAWLIGGGKKEKKFISYIIDQVNEGTTEIKAVNDKFGTITYARELADFIREALDKNLKGVFHFGSRGICSRFEIAKQIISILGSKAIISSVSSNYFSKNFSAPRPDREVIGSRKIEFPKTWQESLENYLRNEIIPEYDL